jgi:hypothetical protein
MKKYVEVFWAPWVDFVALETSFANTIYLPPVPLLGIAHGTIQNKHETLFKCPAVKGLIKNDFVIKSPFDLTLTFDQTTATVSTDNYGQEFFDAYVNNRSIPNGPIILTIPPRYVFFSKDDVEMMSMDLPMISSNSSKNIKMIPGKYNISKWCRPIDFTFTVVDPLLPVTLKVEEPLWAVRFYTPNDVPVKMTRFEITPDIINKMGSMTTLKRFRKFLPLEKCYEMAEGVIQQLKKKF